MTKGLSWTVSRRMTDKTMAKKKDKKTNNEKTGKDHFQLQFKLGGL